MEHSVQPPNHKELALSTLQANQEHQYALAQHAEKLAGELAELDKLLLEADVSDGESELDCDFYIPNAKAAIGPIRNFLNPESPFFGDAMKRTRYLNLTVRHTMPAKEIEALKVAVNAEMRRVEQLQGSSSTTTDLQMLNQLNWSIIAEKVSDASSITRTADECRIKWIGDLSPTVNRGGWTAAEIQHLGEILKKHSNHVNANWVEVAKELGTNRLPIECMRQGMERPRHVWTAEADQKILDAVRQYGTCWSLVAKYVAPDVTAAQCSSRFLRTLDPSLRRGVWSVEEDKRLIAAVAAYGKSWAEVATVVPGRTSEQCRDRWTGSLDPAKITSKKDEWSEEDDVALLEAVKTTGPRWKAIGLQLGRTPTNCRLHYENLKSKDSPAYPEAGPSARDEDEEITFGAPKKSHPPVKIDTPATTKPRPKPIPKNKNVGRGTKRAAPDLEEAGPRKKRPAQQDPRTEPNPSKGPSAAADDTLQPAAEPAPQIANPTAADSGNITPSSTAKKGQRRIPQASTLPRRRSARLKTCADSGETHGTD